VLDRPESLRAEAFQRSPREQPLMDVIDECLRDRRAIVRREVVLPAAGPRLTHLGVSVSPLFDPQGEPHGAICLFTDLTAVKDLEEQLRLKESLATVGELTAGIAHEFRNGLATIHGYSKLVDLNALPAQYRPYIEGIRAETESLSQVVTNFLNFARPAQLTLTEVDLGAICERAAAEIRPDARALGGDVEVSGEFGVVEGDEVLLRQAVSNLLRNALDACAEAAPPRIAIRSDLDFAARVSRITIADNGPGVPAALRTAGQAFRSLCRSSADHPNRLRIRRKNHVIELDPLVERGS
jgi:signal transduction histidine kinase